MLYYFILLFILHVMEAVAGFGSTSIGVPLLALALGTETSVALLSGAGLILCVIVFLNQYKAIQVRELLIILACILPIMPVGYLLYSKLRFIEWALRLTMGLFITLVSAREIWKKMIRKDDSDPPRLLVYASLGLGAIVQGMFSMGGALINVFALTRIKDKSKFRATMVAVWLITNTISLFYRVFVLQTYTQTTWTYILYSIPLVFLAFYIGNKLHHRISNEKFTHFVYIVQLIGGLISMASGLSLLVI